MAAEANICLAHPTDDPPAQPPLRNLAGLRVRESILHGLLAPKSIAFFASDGTRISTQDELAILVGIMRVQMNYLKERLLRASHDCSP